MKLSNSAEAGVVRSVKRACYAGLDSVALRTEVARRIAPVVPYGAYSFSTIDPDTGLFTHAVGEGIPEGVIRAYLEVLYPEEQAVRMLDRARIGDTVSTSTSELFTDLIQTQGVGHELNTILYTGQGLWGDLCLLRESRSVAYTDREQRFMRRIAPHVARGLRTAAILGPEGPCAPESQPDVFESSRTAAGVVVLDRKNQITLRSQTASTHLEDLADVGLPTGDTPYALVSAIALLQTRYRSANVDQAPADTALRVRGRSGRWYILRACLSEPDALAECSTIVTIEPVGRGDVAPILTRLYGLSPREREIVALVARGESTKAIAARLGLSTYTVQEHLGNACEKVGVRGRKALLARLFFDTHAAPSNSAA